MSLFITFPSPLSRVRMYHQGIHISVPQVLELRRVAAFCAEKKYSIFFLPCHKSHIDYLTFSWLIFRLVSRSNLIAVHPGHVANWIRQL